MSFMLTSLKYVIDMHRTNSIKYKNNDERKGRGGDGREGKGREGKGREEREGRRGKESLDCLLHRNLLFQKR